MNVAKNIEYLKRRSPGIYLMKDSALGEESEMMQTDWRTCVSMLRLERRQ